jgi:methyltransferase (TIGR00027 family)
MGAAVLRAVHQLLDDPIVFNDPFALSILGSKVEAEVRADPYSHNDPLKRSFRASFVVRSRVAEDELARGIEAGVRQYVVLGAGLDTFAYRNPHCADLKIFEVDHPSTQEWKRQLLHEANIRAPSNLVFVPVDFETQKWQEQLVQAGFRVDQPACFSWLGVCMYLSDASMTETLSFVAGLPKGSSISFDIFTRPEVLDPVHRVIAEGALKAAASFGEPLLSIFAPQEIHDKLTGLGFSDVHVYDPTELNRIYLHRRKDGLTAIERVVCGRV